MSLLNALALLDIIWTEVVRGEMSNVDDATRSKDVAGRWLTKFHVARLWAQIETSREKARNHLFSFLPRETTHNNRPVYLVSRYVATYLIIFASRYKERHAFVTWIRLFETDLCIPHKETTTFDTQSITNHQLNWNCLQYKKWINNSQLRRSTCRECSSVWHSRDFWWSGYSEFFWNPWETLRLKWLI